MYILIEVDADSSGSAKESIVGRFAKKEDAQDYVTSSYEGRVFDIIEEPVLVEPILNY